MVAVNARLAILEPGSSCHDSIIRQYTFKTVEAFENAVWDCVWSGVVIGVLEEIKVSW
jgi:hypothetical protein